ncbi:MAG TPA: TetR/AcrR family transcriptional regulator, partial [Spirochaetaceae bacterium]|nr:TetR/AcrR family transcriptional regulator [Spirochaetaceae bacterium]
MRNSADEKYDRILDAAAALFARHPFHKVLLSDVARDASVGKGTLYLYFKSKEELYFAVLFRGFSNLVNRLRETLSTSTSDPEAQLGCIVREMVNKLYASETITELLRG